MDNVDRVVTIAAVVTVLRRQRGAAGGNPRLPPPPPAGPGRRREAMGGAVGKECTGSGEMVGTLLKLVFLLVIKFCHCGWIRILLGDVQSFGSGWGSGKVEFSLLPIALSTIGITGSAVKWKTSGWMGSNALVSNSNIWYGFLTSCLAWS